MSKEKCKEFSEFLFFGFFFTTVHLYKCIYIFIKLFTPIYVVAELILEDLHVREVIKCIFEKCQKSVSTEANFYIDKKYAHSNPLFFQGTPRHLRLTT